MAAERARQREIDDLNKKLRMDQGYGGMVVNLKYLYKKK